MTFAQILNSKSIGILYIFFSALFVFSQKKNPFMYQVTWKGFDAKNFLFFKFLSIYIISAEIRAMFLYKIQFKINPCTAYNSLF